jgi:hypothetical protein
MKHTLTLITALLLVPLTAQGRAMNFQALGKVVWATSNFWK